MRTHTYNVDVQRPELRRVEQLPEMGLREVVAEIQRERKQAPHPEVVRAALFRYFK